MLGKEYWTSLIGNQISNSKINKNFTLVTDDWEALNKNQKYQNSMFQSLSAMTPQNINDNKLLKNKANSTNFCLYQSLTRAKNKSKTRSTKLSQKPVFSNKKSRNNLTLDGMNLSSIDALKKIPESNSMIIKMMSKNKKMKGFHSKFHIETPLRKRKNCNSELWTTLKIRKDNKSIEKKTTATKERSIANVLKENIENSLNSKIKILEKDLK